MKVWKWLLLVFALLLIGGCVSVPVLNHLLYSERFFETNHWQSADARQRARMVADLLNRGMLPGKSRTQITDLLGPPDREASVVWEYDYIYGDVIGDTFELPFHGWRYSMWIHFDHATGTVSKVDTRD